MKTSIAAVLGLMFLSLAAPYAAEKPATKEKFYGKVVSVDLAQRNLTVHNTREDFDATFHWDENTNFVSKKKPIQAKDLKVGQSLYVSFVMENNNKKAIYISVRTPFKKSQP